MIACLSGSIRYVYVKSLPHSSSYQVALLAWLSLCVCASRAWRLGSQCAVKCVSDVQETYTFYVHALRPCNMSGGTIRCHMKLCGPADCKVQYTCKLEYPMHGLDM